MQTRLHSRGAFSPRASPVSDAGTYSHSPAHHAVACKDHAALRQIILGLPKPAAAETVRTESDAIAEEEKAEALSAVIDNRDVPGRETPLHVAVRLGDPVSVEVLMSAGADCSLQNENGWSSLQEAICTRQDAIARIIVKYYQPSGWAKWRRRLPRVVAAMNRMRDFYMEISFNFESSVIPLVTRLAPSDTYRIWKQGSNLRTDMTLSGFDGFQIQRSGQTVLFLGEGSADGRLQAGSLCVLDHKTREISNVLDGADKDLTDREVAQEVSLMAQTNQYRPGIDVTQAVLVPQLSWMWQEKVEIVNGWKAKVYEMQNLMISVKSRQVPGAMSDEEFLGSLQKFRGGDDGAGEEHLALMTAKDSKQDAEKASTSKAMQQDVEIKRRERAQETRAKQVGSPTAGRTSSMTAVDTKKGRLGQSQQAIHQEPAVTQTPSRKSTSSQIKVSNLAEHFDGDDQSASKKSRRFLDAQQPAEWELEEASKHMNERKYRSKNRGKLGSDSGSKESEFKKGLRPVLWLTPDFPLKTEELLPLLDILANKVKAIRRLRELLTTKLPPGTFPVKIAFPVIPTIRVVISFSRFEEMHDNEDSQALSSAIRSGGLQDEYYQSSWLSWIKGPTTKPIDATMQGHLAEGCNPFVIPKDYKWNKPVVQKGKKVALTK